MIVTYVATSGEKLIIDVEHMYEENLSTGLRHPLCRKRNQGQWKWFYDLREKEKEKAKWASYPSDVCTEIEIAYSEHANKGIGNPTCDATWQDGISISDGMSTSASITARSTGALAGSGARSLEDSLHHLEVVEPGYISLQEAQSIQDLALSPSANPRIAFSTLRLLIHRHHVRCTLEEVRRVALLVGSMSMLQLVLSSDSNLQLMGMQIFDRRYPGQFKLNEQGRKHCLKAILARGAFLGPANLVPTSKLLRKIEGDAFGEWAQRYLDSMVVPGLPPLPDRVRHFIGEFIGLEGLNGCDVHCLS